MTMAMKELRPLAPRQRATAEERLRNPRPGSRIEAVQRFGIGPTRWIENLRLSPAERARGTHEVARVAEQVRGAQRRGLA